MGAILDLGCLSFRHFVLFDLILYVPSTIFQLCRDGSAWVEARINVSCSRKQHSDAGEA